MPETDEVRKAISYVTGEIKLEFHAPNGFDVKPTVLVDGIEAVVKPTDGDEPIIWKYLAIVEKGERNVEVILGNVHSMKRVSVRGGQISILNFRFTTSE